MLFENTMSILKQVGIIVVFLLEECDGDDWRDGCPDKDVLLMTSALHKSSMGKFLNLEVSLRDTSGIVNKVAQTLRHMRNVGGVRAYKPLNLGMRSRTFEALHHVNGNRWIYLPHRPHDSGPVVLLICRQGDGTFGFLSYLKHALFNGPVVIMAPPRVIARVCPNRQSIYFVFHEKS
jgi:hypothetical protein